MATIWRVRKVERWLFSGPDQVMYPAPLELKVTSSSQSELDASESPVYRDDANCVLGGLEMQPVNYGIRFSGPVTALTARRLRYGVGPGLTCQPGPSPGIKTHFVPRRFSNNSLLFFCSLPFSHFPTPPPRASGRAELHLLPCQAP
jgi:hypothetical protein